MNPNVNTKTELNQPTCVCMHRLCFAHCWAVNRSWLWQEVGITILPMSPMFIFCLFRQCWLLHTHPPLHACTDTHQLLTFRCVCVCVYTQGAHVRVLFVEARSDDCLLSRKGNKISLCKDVGWAGDMIRQGFTCSVNVHVWWGVNVCWCVMRRIWRRFEGAITCPDVCVCVHSSFVHSSCIFWPYREIKAPFSLEQRHAHNAHLYWIHTYYRYRQWKTMHTSIRSTQTHTVVLSLGAPSALSLWPWVFPHNVLL